MTKMICPRCSKIILENAEEARVGDQHYTQCPYCMLTFLNPFYGDK